MFYAIFILIHLIICLALIFAVLMQSGKGGGLAGTFGGSASQAVFGGRGAATFLSKATTTLAITFFVSSIILGILGGRRSGTDGETATERVLKMQETQGTSAPVAAPTEETPSPLETFGTEQFGAVDQGVIVVPEPEQSQQSEEKPEQ